MEKKLYPNVGIIKPQTQETAKRMTSRLKLLRSRNNHIHNIQIPENAGKFQQMMLPSIYWKEKEEVQKCNNILSIIYLDSSVRKGV